MAVFGNRMIMGGLGWRFLIRSLRNRLGRLLWRLRIRTLFMWLAGRGCSGLIFQWGMEFINLPMRGRLGRILDCAMASRFRLWWLIRWIQIDCLRRFWGIRLARTSSAGSFGLWMAGRLGSACF